MLELRDVHVDIASAMVGLVGRNGAGKTSTLRSIMGHLTPHTGQILFDGQDLVQMPAHVRAGLGIGYMPEDRGLVPELTVEENIVLPLWVSPTLSLDARLAWVYEVLPELKAMSDRRALLLSGGAFRGCRACPVHAFIGSHRAAEIH
jgi:branched-chain amino acid transport system ATP-binding protein